MMDLEERITWKPGEAIVGKKKEVDAIMAERGLHFVPARTSKEPDYMNKKRRAD